MNARIKSLAAVSAILLAVALFFFAAGRLEENISVSSAGTERMTVVIDPGHGGMDGGAIGADGTVEKDMNLAVALQLRDLLTLAGYDAVMTRETDISIHDEGVEGVREQKKSDIRNRLKIMEEHPDALVIMIHQNQFSQPQYSGAQMFYGPNDPASETVARRMQEAFRQLQPDNTREIKPGTRDIYLLWNCKNPIVLAECGFISNPEECAKLQTPEYQRQVAFAILNGILAGRADGADALQQT